MATFIRLLTRKSAHPHAFIHPSRFHWRALPVSGYHAFVWRSTRIIPRLIAVGGLGLCFAVLSRPVIYCDGEYYQSAKTMPEDHPSPPQSSVSFYRLTFGTVTGFCTGIFIKKGAKAVAWFLGGIFILLQYLRSASLIRVNWTGIATRFEDFVYIRETRKPPTLGSIWHWLVDFLTADFQPRASFVAGLALGFRLG